VPWRRLRDRLRAQLILARRAQPGSNAWGAGQRGCRWLFAPACPGRGRPLLGPMLQRILPPGFVPPCLPTKAKTPPSGGLWLHEIKHDGFRVIARKDGDRVRLYSRPGNDLTDHFPLIVDSLSRLRSRSCILDGEAVCCDDDGRPASSSTPSI
jgi:ATP-dependent DNA ligase